MIRCALSSITPKRPSGKISSTSPSMTISSSLGTPSGSVGEVDRGGLAVLAGLELVADLLLFAQRAEARLLDGADVDEGVRAAGVVGDEAVAAVGIEEFDGAGGHDPLLS